MTTKVLAVTEVSRRFQTTIPKEVRDKLELTEEDKILWAVEDNKIIVRKA